jgi:hypothetical protein
VWPRPPAVGEDLRVGAAGVFQGIGQDGEAVGATRRRGCRGTRKIRSPLLLHLDVSTGPVQSPGSITFPLLGIGDSSGTFK